MTLLHADLLFAPSFGKYEIPNSYLHRVCTGGRTQTLRNAARRLLWQASFAGCDAQLIGPPS
jgi:hypothetical protein